MSKKKILKAILLTLSVLLSTAQNLDVKEKPAELSAADDELELE